jgi:ribose transport system substrate-binding protein
MVYNAIKGNYAVSTDGFYEILFPYLYVASPEDYAAYATLFVDELPYDAEELKAMAAEDFDGLAATAGALSIADVQARHASLLKRLCAGMGGLPGPGSPHART